MTPELQERLCYTATQCRSYEAAAKTAAKWGVEVDASAIFKHVQRIGADTRMEHELQTSRALDVRTRQEVIKEARAAAPRNPFSLVIMMDGWMIRERGEQWGLKPPQAQAQRVEWREMKTAIVFRLENRVETQSARRIVLEKHWTAHRGDPHEFGRRVYALALRHGMVQAQNIYVVADGAVWIWNIVEDRFGQARPLLDFYHASQHLWAVARAVYPDDKAARDWVEPLLRRLRHGGERGVLNSLRDLGRLAEKLDEQTAKDLQREINYFETHREHIGYQQAAAEGRPIGSGAIESSCSQLQDRFKRTGQFWKKTGCANLMALDLGHYS